jgi:magnesium chelatase subunit D
MIDSGSGKKASPEPRAEVPFPAIVGQGELKEALLAVAANDALDGLLVRGEKGTAKSTAVRALTDLLPPQEAIADCPYGCPPDDPESQCADCREREDPPVETRPVPLVTLPLGATRERVVGTLSVEKALDGDPEFDPGLLARANRGILYVDEVNLLDDHLVDVLLDAAASGTNRVERDGVSVTHPAEFTLIGTMNPEEGDLRPQLRDRFALQATVTGCRDVEDRVAIIEDALARDTEGGRAAYDAAEETADLRETLRVASESVTGVELPDEFAVDIATLCRDAGVDGHRADIATARAAKTFAALAERPKVIEADVRKAAELTLPHRLQSDPFEDAADPEDVLDDHFDDEEDGEEEDADDDASDGEDGDEKTEADEQDDDGGEDQSADETDEDGADAEDDEQDAEGDGEDDAGSQPAPTPSGAEAGEGESDQQDDDGSDADDDADEQEGTPLIPGQQRADVGEARAPEVDAPSAEARDGATAGGSRTSVTASVDNEGARVRTERAESDDAIDAAASVRAAASRGSTAVQSRDLRRSVKAGETSALVTFAVDASASMRGPMRTAKGVAIDLLEDAYQQRDEVSLVAFAGEDAEVLLPPTDSVTLAARHLKDLPTGDRTPLPAGMRTAGEVIERADPDVGIVVLVTDGRPNTTEGDGSPTAETRAAAKRLAAQGTHVVVVDAGREDDRTLTDDIAAITDGEQVPLSALSPERVEAAVARAQDDRQ